ncbi:right-handed parallel beta-helix repeat-containing protein [Flammeovirga kamogawensis]|uniref:Right-handed parallel beta-helix repeat-containing protein n=1 Tax=Flammeovirga kamogawensis TaxID=373891 RepID=A0ABX8H3E2_9BACT|nr:right-handed parallel beta-helix repeat-containing protein [Flammeovirga kamogawensis]MBB6462589.1 hypothetical protein [Flammeovirga kamogawensis]QWG09665.1 right-handed parallel beta-helix repeat-containing protein [Flammeovirga kamogawensis]TRX65179.1 right-handed parallel beta-helix repeat-containing protein [Flammeovirga kamogawensis]
MNYINRSILTFFCIIFGAQLSAAKDYFFDFNTGSNTNPGTKEQPYKDFKVIENLSLKGGDKLLFLGETTFKGELVLLNLNGEKDNPIVISSYGKKGTKALIDAKGERNGISIVNCSYILIDNIEITADGGKSNQPVYGKKPMRCGILVVAKDQIKHQDIKISNVVIRDIFYAKKGVTRSKEETHSAMGNQSYGYGIRYVTTNIKTGLSNMYIENTTVNNVGHTGIKYSGKKQNINNIKLYSSKVLKSGGPGIQMSLVKDVHVMGNTVMHSGSNSDSRKWARGSGLWTWGADNVLIEKNEFKHARGPADSAGAHIDFNCSNVILQYNLSVDNAGGFCEILGNNYNCAYRYNVSINDGFRVKEKGVNPQSGKIFWLSGFVGKNKERNGPFNTYFYNNTIFVKKGIQANIAIDKNAKGALIANNIFYVEQDMQRVLGDQYKAEKGGTQNQERMFCKNNLFLSSTNWPTDLKVQPTSSIIGDPKFRNSKGMEIADFTPKNKKLISGKGISIEKIIGDDIGLKGGLKMNKDILGNSFKGKPDVGAIQLKNKIN